MIPAIGFVPISNDSNIENCYPRNVAFNSPDNILNVAALMIGYVFKYPCTPLFFTSEFSEFHQYINRYTSIYWHIYIGASSFVH